MQSHLPPNEEQGSTPHVLTTSIAVYGGGASHIVKVQVEPNHRRAARGLVCEGEHSGGPRGAHKEFTGG